MAKIAAPVRKDTYQNTTVRMPRRVYERARAAVKKSEEISSLNEFVVEAVKDKLQDLEESEIDAAFAEMGNDADYQRSSAEMAREFQHSDWEAFNESQKAGDEHDTKRNQPKTPKR